MEFFIFQSQYKTFAELYPQVSNENWETESITITEYEEIDGDPEQKNEIKMKDEEIIAQIISEISNKEYNLKENPEYAFQIYVLQFENKKEIKENHFKYDYVTVSFTEQELENDINNLKTVKSILESKGE